MGCTIELTVEALRKKRILPKERRLKHSRTPRDEFRLDLKATRGLSALSLLGAEREILVHTRHWVNQESTPSLVCSSLPSTGLERRFLEANLLPFFFPCRIPPVGLEGMTSSGMFFSNSFNLMFNDS